MISDVSRNSLKRVFDRREFNERPSLINTMACKFDAVRLTAATFGMRESIDNWDVYWTDTSVAVERCREMKRYQRINHFPGMLEICRKDQLARNLNRLSKLYPEEFNFFPRTWCLRTEMKEVLDYAKIHKSEVYIIKPNFSSEGKGICITNNVNRLRRCDDVICQVYIQKPLLIDGYKFDLRVYTLITSCEPLRIFVYNEGLARFATAEYRRPDSLNAGNQFMHLTNYSVNKHSQAFVVGDDGTKRRLSSINHWLINNNYDVKKIWKDVDDAIIKTVMASVPTIRHEYHVAFPHHKTSTNCFELLGFDFIFDCQIKPYILEVNHAPSLHLDTEIDHEVKKALLFDTFNILNLQRSNRSDILAEERRRIRERLFSTFQTDSYWKSVQEDKVQQAMIEWENTHKGNYRKIYPGKRTDHYEQYIRCQSSIFAGTFSSRAKERGSPKYRTARYKIFLRKQMQIPVTSEAKLRKRPTQSKSANASPPAPPPTAFEPCRIDDAEEKERITALKQRDSLIKSYGLVEKVYNNFKEAGLLRKLDETKALNTSLDRGERKQRYFEEASKYNSANIHRALESITRSMDPQFDRSTSNRMNSAFILKQKVESGDIDDGEEKERIMSREKRGFLVESLGIHKVVHDYFKQAGLLKLEERVKSKKTSSQSQQHQVNSSGEMNGVGRSFSRNFSNRCNSLGNSRGRNSFRKDLEFHQERHARVRPKTASGCTAKEHRLITLLESLHEALTEKHKCAGKPHDVTVSTISRNPKTADSPEVWATPPEEFSAEVPKIQPEFWLNPQVP